jgi:CheY-like chemotaxis protein
VLCARSLSAPTDAVNVVPVIVITARDAVTDRIAGLDSGADDYIVKPFDLDELAARIRPVQRRHVGRSGTLLRVGHVVLDPVKRRVSIDGRDDAVEARSERERVFDRFYRAVGSDSGGSGLGLAIVLSIAERHGARVTLQTGPDGTGLAAQIIFPRSAPAST